MYPVYNSTIKVEQHSKERRIGYYWGEQQRTKSCSGYSWRGQNFHNVRQARRLDSMFRFDPDFKEYGFKPILDMSNPPLEWWDEKKRRAEGNWKSQYKSNRQYNNHSKGKDSGTIRRVAGTKEGDFSREEIESMLEVEFILKQSA